MPTRIIRDGILRSDRVNSLSPHAELFYRRLMSVADDHGRYYANPSLLRADCYPLKLDSVKEDSIKKHLAECVDAGLLVLYTAEGKRYLVMLDYGQRINGKSKFPDPPGNPGESRGIPVDSRLDVDVDVDEGEGDTPIVPKGTSAEAVLDAYHSTLPGCKAIAVLNPKRRKRIAAAEKLARQVCAQQGWPYQPAEFWKSYFGECANDPWMRGEVANPKNAAWRQNLDVLIAEDRFAGIMDSAIANMRGRA